MESTYPKSNPSTRGVRIVAGAGFLLSIFLIPALIGFVSAYLSYRLLTFREGERALFVRWSIFFMILFFSACVFFALEILITNPIGVDAMVFFGFAIFFILSFVYNAIALFYLTRPKVKDLFVK